MSARRAPQNRRRQRQHCRFCGAATFSRTRCCGSHLDLLEQELDTIAATFLDQVPEDPLESLPLMAAELHSEDAHPRSGTGL